MFVTTLAPQRGFFHDLFYFAFLALKYLCQQFTIQLSQDSQCKEIMWVLHKDAFKHLEITSAEGR